MKSKLHRWALMASCAVLFGCGGGAMTSPSGSEGGASMTPVSVGSGTSGQQQTAAAGDSSAQRLDSLSSARVPLPSGAPATLDAGAISSAANAAQVMSGSRGAFEDFHQNVAPLLPSPSLAAALGGSAGASLPGTAKALSLAPPVDDICIQIGNIINIDGDVNILQNCIIINPPPPQPPGNNCPVVCATACATATASAVAEAFAHASATACAWAQAWACVYNGVFPFNRVCAWAQSQACFTAFAVAFGKGWANDSEEACQMRCTDGALFEFRRRPAANI